MAAFEGAAFQQHLMATEMLQVCVCVRERECVCVCVDLRRVCVPVFSSHFLDPLVLPVRTESYAFGSRVLSLLSFPLPMRPISVCVSISNRH